MEKQHAYDAIKFVCSLFLLLLSLQLRPVQATELEKWLIMPGPVVSSHADIESKCGSCHAPLSDRLQGELCVACHVEVGSDVESGTGFHGRLDESKRMNCATCHTDHEGRDFDIVDFDAAQFDHSRTDFALLGSHALVACDACHAAGSTYRRAGSTCVSCHQADDVHNGQFGNDCATCHNNNEWQKAKFDHDNTRFPLEGAHAIVACAGCHESGQFDGADRTCVACHRQDDVHKGRNGTQCADCHGVTDWSDATFDHLAMTGFGLIGGHKNATCQACHRASDFSGLAGSTCIACHDQDDAHGGRFGADCGSCHTVFRWDSVHFDHEVTSGFVLPAGHDSLACKACHVNNIDETLPTDCGSCHVDDDVHKGQLDERCETCHVATHWTAQLWFDHDITIFPLIGEHAGIPCASCHSSSAFHDADTACVSCHAEDDFHHGGLGDQCDTCHNPGNWRTWRFDHDLQTEFPLTGAHVGVTCAACHVEKVIRPGAIRSDCNTCHRRDDPHLGRFGNGCENCHTTTSFAQIEGM